jgi:hypothetical protein
MLKLAWRPARISEGQECRGEGHQTDQRAKVGLSERKPVGNWVVMPILILLFAGVYLALFSPLITWMLGEGTQGTFVARNLDCQKGCAWFGDFTSANRKIVLQDVRFANINDLPNIRTGTVIPVTDISSVLYNHAAYPRLVTPRDFRSPSVLVAVLVGFVPIVLLLLWIWTVPVRYWRRKAAARWTG